MSLTVFPLTVVYSSVFKFEFAYFKIGWWPW
jgi:hypothetical protein